MLGKTAKNSIESQENKCRILAEDTNYLASNYHILDSSRRSTAARLMGLIPVKMDRSSLEIKFAESKCFCETRN